MHQKFRSRINSNDRSRREFMRTATLGAGYLLTSLHSFAEKKQSETNAIRLIIDADTANEVDDAFAIAWALIEPKLKIEGISSAQWHTQERAPNDTVRASQKMNEDILTLMGKTDIPHPIGANFPLVNQLRPQPSDAAKFIIAKAHQSSGNEKLTVAILGPATNVASAILLDQSIIPKIKCCYLGTWYHPEENTWSKREFNTNNDPNALDVLLNTHGLEVEIMTATASKALVFSKEDTDAHFKGKGGVRDYLVDRWESYDRFWKKADPEKLFWTMWDVAILEAIAHPEMATKQEVLTPHDNLKRTISAYTAINSEMMTQNYWQTFNSL